MELDELKNVWISVDERLKKQEILNEYIIREMTCKKTNKSLMRLFWFDGINILTFLLLLPFIVYAYGKFGGKYIFWDSSVILAGVFCVANLPFLCYRVYRLMKIDLSENIKSNLYYINRFSLQIKWEKNLMAFIGPVMFILISLTFIERKANASLWTFWICGVILSTLFSYWSYKKIYDKNIQSIKKYLQELKELKEEPEEKRADFD